MKTKLPIVIVDWVDAVFDTHNPPKPLALHTVGFLYEQTADYITLAMESREVEDEPCRDYITIPANYVTAITVLIESRSKRSTAKLKSKSLSPTG